MLYGIKGCHACSLRTGCPEKNSPINLSDDSVKLEKTIHTHIGPRTIQLVSFCLNFVMEGHVAKKD